MSSISTVYYISANTLVGVSSVESFITIDEQLQ